MGWFFVRKSAPRIFRNEIQVAWGMIQNSPIYIIYIYIYNFEDLKKISCAIQHSCQEIPQSVQDFEPVPPVVEP